MKMPISEIADRYSIALLKRERADADNDIEISILHKELIQYPDALNFVTKLLDVNGRIWDLESDIRKGKENELGLDEVGRRAIAIRELNKTRVSYKNELVKLYKEGFEDIKMNHASE